MITLELRDMNFISYGMG